ncbi:MAG TPA: sulfate transporter [Aeromonas salmonicida]|nr:sulfate transporter [Aeromonas salmonicida]HBL04260.1 sulfate transporter [Aeromonas salmonicida]
MQEAQTASTTPMRQNAQGHWVPENLIAPADKLRDEVVMAIIAAAREQRAQLVAFKIGAMQQIADFVDLSAEQYGVAWGGTKGNVTLLSFDGRYKLIRAVGEHRKFDERIQAAKALIDQCIERWSDGASSEIRALVDHAFRVSKSGHIDVNQVLSLRQLNIDDPDWLLAMQAAVDAIQVTGTSQYLRLYERDGQGRYIQMSLDLAKL